MLKVVYRKYKFLIIQLQYLMIPQADFSETLRIKCTSDDYPKQWIICGLNTLTKLFELIY